MKTNRNPKSIVSTSPEPTTATSLIERNSIVRIDALCKMTGISRSMAYAKMAHYGPHYDPDFPSRIKIGVRSVGWRLLDVINYINSLGKA